MQTNVVLRKMLMMRSSSLTCYSRRLRGSGGILSNSRHQPTSFLSKQYQSRRNMAVYAVGEGWTGALGQENVLSTIHGHFDEEPCDEPKLVFPRSKENGDVKVKQVVAGWGCSIILDDEGHIYTIGRPQDLMTLFRLRRMPTWVRDWICSNSDPSDTTIVGTAISKIIGLASGDAKEQPWDIAKEYSYLHDWTKMDYQAGETSLGDTAMSNVVAGPGFMAMIGTSGALYTLGLNNRGQCGIGQFTNNVWTPHPVKGITNEKHEKDVNMIQDQPVIQVSLGFQHGFALTKNGQVYSWGKTQRGQLGRTIEADQDPTARLIQFDTSAHNNKDKLVTQISSAHHHGTALTVDNEIYMWGKNMKISSDNDEIRGKKPEDLTKPTKLTGLPKNKQILKITSGSHHTAMLMEDGSVYAIGIASDEPIPMLEPVLMVEAGVLELPLRQFEASQDRTTIIDNGGNVFQVHLWKNPNLQEYSLFTPLYLDSLLEQGESIQSIHRGWRHTLIVTAPN